MSVPITWGGSDLFTHMLVVGATRSGKTATILKPIIYQLLLAKKRGVPLGISVVEPKGDVAQMLADMAREMDLECTHIDPMQPEISGKFNPMEGDTDSVAEATVIVLKGLFGKQDAFFATVQELSARNVVKLLKELHGDDMDIMDVLVALRDPAVLKQKVAELERLQGNTDLVDFFKSELLGSMADKYRQFVIGLRAQLENIVSNKALRDIITSKSSIDIDEHFEKGGLLAVNTALGMLRSSGDAFGQFVTMHLQNATFRRPATEDDSVVPHFMIVDEYSRYINPDVEIFLSLAATYKVSGIFAVQSLSQLEIESGKYSAQAMRNSILTNSRNKIVFGGVAMDDARAFSEMFGEDEIVMRQSTYKNRIVLPNLFPDSYRDTETEEARFSATDIMDQLPRFTYVHQLMQGGKLQEPGLGIGDFVPREWKELREWEKKPITEKTSIDGIKKLFTSKKKEQEQKEKAVQEHFDRLNDELGSETDAEVESFERYERDTEIAYQIQGENYKRELAEQGITEDNLKLSEIEIQEIHMSGGSMSLKENADEIDLFNEDINSTNRAGQRDDPVKANGESDIDADFFPMEQSKATEEDEDLPSENDFPMGDELPIDEADMLPLEEAPMDKQNENTASNQEKEEAQEPIKKQKEKTKFIPYSSMKKKEPPTVNKTRQVTDEDDDDDFWF